MCVCNTHRYLWITVKTCACSTKGSKKKKKKKKEKTSKFSPEQKMASDSDFIQPWAEF